MRAHFLDRLETIEIYLLAKLIVIGMAVQLLVIVYVGVSSYVSRENTVTAQRAACERGKKDRLANASGWRTAETARLSGLANARHISIAQAAALMYQTPRPDDLSDLIAARRYNKLAEDLESRSRIVCAKVFPKASLLP